MNLSFWDYVDEECARSMFSALMGFILILCGILCAFAAWMFLMLGMFYDALMSVYLGAVICAPSLVFFKIKQIRSQKDDK